MMDPLHRLRLTNQLREFPTTLAQATDLDSILAIQDEHWIVPQLAQGVTEEQLRYGFLVHKLTRPELGRLLGCPEAAIIVCKFYGEVVGYAVGYTLAHHIHCYPEYWPDTICDLEQADQDRFFDEWHNREGRIWYYRQQAVTLHYKRLGVATLLSSAVRWFALGRGCTSTIGEIVEAPYYNQASFGTLSKGSRIIGRIPDLYEGIQYTWAVVETPLS